MGFKGWEIKLLAGGDPFWLVKPNTLPYLILTPAKRWGEILWSKRFDIPSHLQQKTSSGDKAWATNPASPAENLLARNWLGYRFRRGSSQFVNRPRLFSLLRSPAWRYFMMLSIFPALNVGGFRLLRAFFRHLKNHFPKWKPFRQPCTCEQGFDILLTR